MDVGKRKRSNFLELQCGPFMSSPVLESLPEALAGAELAWGANYIRWLILIFKEIHNCPDSSTS